MFDIILGFDVLNIVNFNKFANGPSARVREFFNFSTKKFVLKSYWEIRKGKVQEKSSVRALSKAHKITLI